MSEHVVHQLEFTSEIAGTDRIAYLLGYAEAHGSVTLSKNLANFILLTAISDAHGHDYQRRENERLRRQVAELKKKLKEKA